MNKTKTVNMMVSSAGRILLRSSCVTRVGMGRIRAGMEIGAQTCSISTMNSTSSSSTLSKVSLSHLYSYGVLSTWSHHDVANYFLCILVRRSIPSRT